MRLGDLTVKLKLLHKRHKEGTKFTKRIMFVCDNNKLKLSELAVKLKEKLLHKEDTKSTKEMMFDLDKNKLKLSVMASLR